MQTHSSTRLHSIDEALALIAAEIRPLPAEDLPLERAAGRLLARDLTAAVDLPPFPCSAMDGYALRARDTPGSLLIAGESAAGSPYEGTLQPGQAVALSTGALIPDGADAVVPLEDVEISGEPDREVTLVEPIQAGAYIRERASDLPRGHTLLTAGTRLGPAQIGAAAAAGLGELSCRRVPRVAVLTTGTELRPPGEPLGPGEIYDANRPMLAAALATAGADLVSVPAAADTRDAHRDALRRALREDVVISSGGVSVGPHDLVRSVAAELGVRELLWRIAMKPGKPLSFGLREREGQVPTLVFGLPGNPVSTLVCFEIFVRPALLALQGAPDSRPRFASGILALDIPRNRQRDELIRVTRSQSPDHQDLLTPVAGQQSHQIAIAAAADGLALIPRGTGSLSAGTTVSYLPLGV